MDGMRASIPPAETISGQNARPIDVPAFSEKTQLGKTGNARQSFHIRSLDGIRAVSIGMVFFAHLNLVRFSPGMFGVNVFFLLSGFLITTLMIREHATTGRTSIKQFYIRRALRIFPPMYIVLATSALIALSGVIAWNFSLRGLLLQCFHLTNYEFIRTGGGQSLMPGLGVYWSLAVEEHFYLIFPLVFSLCYGRLGPRRLATWLTAMALAVFAWRAVLVMLLHTTDANRTGVATDTRIDSIMWGCILALWRNPALDPASARPLASPKFCIPALIVLVSTLIYHNPVFRETARYTLESVCLIPLFCAAILRTDWSITAFLNFRAVRWLGQISYTFYLVHFMFFIVLSILFPKWPHWEIVLAVLSCTLLFSQAMRLAVEIPLARVRKRHGGT